MPLGGLATAGLIVGGATGLLQTGMGIADRAKGKRKLREAQSFYQKNKYDIPESARAALGVGERQASSMRLPGEDIARARQQAVTSRGVGAAQQAATSSSDVLTMLSSLYGNEAVAEQNMAMAGAERFDRNQQQLQRALGIMGGYEDQRWKYNVLSPYQQMLGQAEAYQTRGTQELSAGLSALGSTAGAAAQMGGAQQRYDQFMMNTVGEQWQPTSMAGARMQQNAARQNLPSYNYNYGNPFTNGSFTNPTQRIPYTRDDINNG